MRGGKKNEYQMHLIIDKLSRDDLREPVVLVKDYELEKTRKASAPLVFFFMFGFKKQEKQVHSMLLYHFRLRKARNASAQQCFVSSRCHKWRKSMRSTGFREMDGLAKPAMPGLGSPFWP